MRWTDALVKSVSEKQEQAIDAAYKLLNAYGLSIDEVKTIVESKTPESPYADGVMFLTKQHEECWTEMLDYSLEELTSDFGQQIQNRRLLQDWLGDE